MLSSSLVVNRARWDERAPAHAASPQYAVDRFRVDPGFLSKVVRFDVPRLGDVRGLRCVHLQCHIGTDTVSLARLGADMTGLDFSAASLQQARQLADAAGVTVSFVEAELYRALEVLPTGEFDLVYTGIGALCWLPPWADDPARRQRVAPHRPAGTPRSQLHTAGPPVGIAGQLSAVILS